MSFYGIVFFHLRQQWECCVGAHESIMFTVFHLPRTSGEFWNGLNICAQYTFNCNLQEHYAIKIAKVCVSIIKLEYVQRTCVIQYMRYALIIRFQVNFQTIPFKLWKFPTRCNKHKHTHAHAVVWVVMGVLCSYRMIYALLHMYSCAIHRCIHPEWIFYNWKSAFLRGNRYGIYFKHFNSILAIGKIHAHTHSNTEQTLSWTLSPTQLATMKWCYWVK